MCGFGTFVSATGSLGVVGVTTGGVSVTASGWTTGAAF
jgi:hypothetical protein